MRPSSLCLLAAAGTTNMAAAYPDGAPWGSADPGAAENCATCHFSSDPILNSDAIEIDGWPRLVSAGDVYELVFRFAAREGASAGMQVLVRSGGAEAGAFLAAPDGLETDGAKARTTVPRPFTNGEVSWRLEWRAPDPENGRVTMCVGASAANGDASALGDTVHFRCVEADIPDAPNGTRWSNIR